MKKTQTPRKTLAPGIARVLKRLHYLVAVPAANTSRMCPSCAHVAKENRKTQALFACVACQYENNADHVGSINVLERG